MALGGLGQHAPSGKPKLRPFLTTNLRTKQAMHNETNLVQDGLLIHSHLCIGRQRPHNDHGRHGHDYNRHETTVTSIHVPGAKLYAMVTYVRVTG